MPNKISFNTTPPVLPINFVIARYRVEKASGRKVNDPSAHTAGASRLARRFRAMPSSTRPHEINSRSVGRDSLDHHFIPLKSLDFPEQTQIFAISSSNFLQPCCIVGARTMSPSFTRFLVFASSCWDEFGGCFLAVAESSDSHKCSLFAQLQTRPRVLCSSFPRDPETQQGSCGSPSCSSPWFLVQSLSSASSSLLSLSTPSRLSQEILHNWES